MSEVPLVTIGITAFNCESTIERAILSCLKQTYTNIQVIVVNDCSTDKTADILSAYQDRIQIINHEKNQGVAVARNTIVFNAKGSYIAFLDDDDENELNRIEVQLRELVASSPRSIHYSSRLQIFSPNASRYESGLLPISTDKILVTNVMRWVFLGRFQRELVGSAGTGTMMASREVFDRVGEFDIRFRRLEDMDFLIRAIQSGVSVITSPPVLLRQFVNVSNDKNPSKERDSLIMLAEKYRDLLIQLRLIRLVRTWIEFKYAIQSRMYFQALIQISKLFFISPKSFYIILVKSALNAKMVFLRLSRT